MLASSPAASGAPTLKGGTLSQRNPEEELPDQTMPRVCHTIYLRDGSSQALRMLADLAMLLSREG